MHKSIRNCFRTTILDLLGIYTPTEKGDSQALVSPLSPSSQALAPSGTKFCRPKYQRYRPSLAPSTLNSVRDQSESIPLLSFARNISQLSSPECHGKSRCRQALITLNVKRGTQGEVFFCCCTSLATVLKLVSLLPREIKASSHLPKNKKGDPR